MKVLVLGSTGMAGHVISSYLEDNGVSVINTTRHPVNGAEDLLFFDAIQPETLESTIKNSNFDAVINATAILNKESEIYKLDAIKVNSYLPLYLEQLLKDSKTKLIHISTDAVFSGKESTYNEGDLPDASTFYGKTKLLGEINNSKDVTIRTSIIGPSLNSHGGSGLLDWFLLQKSEVSGYTNVNWCGVTTYELAKNIYKFITNDAVGIYHLVPKDSISKYDLLSLFNEIFTKNIKINKAQGQTINTKLICTRNGLIEPTSNYRIMIEDLKVWMDTHESFYNQYKK